MCLYFGKGNGRCMLITVMMFWAESTGYRLVRRNSGLAAGWLAGCLLRAAYSVPATRGEPSGGQRYQSTFGGDDDLGFGYLKRGACRMFAQCERDSNRRKTQKRWAFQQTTAFVKRPPLVLEYMQQQREREWQCGWLLRRLLFCMLMLMSSTGL